MSRGRKTISLPALQHFGVRTQVRFSIHKADLRLHSGPRVPLVL